MILRTKRISTIFPWLIKSLKEKTRNIILRNYFKDIKNYINLPFSKLVADCGHGVVRSVSKNSTSQFTLPSETTYEKLKDKYHINESHLQFLVYYINHYLFLLFNKYKKIRGTIGTYSLYKFFRQFGSRIFFIPAQRI